MIKNNKYLCLDERTEVGVHILCKVSVKVDIACMYNITHDVR